MAEILVKTGYGDGNSNFPIELYVTYSYSQSTENNQSYITCGMYVTTPSYPWNIGPWTDFDGSYVGKSSLTFDGSIPNFSGRRTLTSSKQFTVDHDAEGKASATIYWQWGVRSSWGGYDGGTNSGSFTISLPDIPKQAELLTAPNFSDGDNPTITYTNPAGDAVYSLQACIYWSGGSIPYRDVPTTGSSYTFNLTESERKALLNAVTDGNSMPVTFELATEIGGETYISTLRRTFSVVNAKPIVSGSVVDTNSITIALTGDSRKLIKHYSNAQATMSATPQKGAAINEDLFIIRNGNSTGYGSTHTFNNVESNVFTFSAEDSRGNVGTASVTADMVDYIKLTCNISNNRPDASGNMTISCSGNYFNGSFGAASNTLTVQYRYKVYGGSWSSWTDMPSTKNGNSYHSTIHLTGLDYRLTYSFETRAIDELSTITSTESSVKSKPIFHWGENDFVFEVPVTFNAGASGMSVIPEEGVWYPALSSSAISSYTTQKGWYQKIGQVVTVGFFIKATCSTGYDGMTIQISGLPFTPIATAAGGGMCSGAYVSGGFNFQCYVAESSGFITTRVQASNNTSATNLSTSASGCCYRSGGGEITLSGTITYMANS